jgi:hypothetical protein
MNKYQHSLLLGIFVLIIGSGLLFGCVKSLYDSEFVQTYLEYHNKPQEDVLPYKDTLIYPQLPLIIEKIPHISVDTLVKEDTIKPKLKQKQIKVKTNDTFFNYKPYTHKDSSKKSIILNDSI